MNNICHILLEKTLDIQTELTYKMIPYLISFLEIFQVLWLSGQNVYWVKISNNLQWFDIFFLSPKRNNKSQFQKEIHKIIRCLKFIIIHLKIKRSICYCQIISRKSLLPLNTNKLSWQKGYMFTYNYTNIIILNLKNIP